MSFQDAKTRRYTYVRLIFGARRISIAERVVEQPMTHLVANHLKLRVGRRSMMAATGRCKEQRDHQKVRGKPDQWVGGYCFPLVVPQATEPEAVTAASRLKRIMLKVRFAWLIIISAK